VRLTKIQMHGYRRLVETSCFICGKLTCFIGPNEVGKSSLLAALRTVNDPDELPQRDRPRGRQHSEHDPYIELTFRLSDDDLDAVGHLKMTEAPISLRFQIS